MSRASKPVVFDFQDYKSYVDAWIKSHPNGGHGIRSRIAGQIRCHLAYVSQVLNGPAQFSLEQAESLNTLLEHNEDEGEFFLLLVEKERAGTPSLRRFFEKKIRRALDQRLVLKTRFVDKKSLNREDQATYYSHWAYCAVHMALLIPDLRTPGAIAEHFGLPIPKVVKILEGLEAIGLVERNNGLFAPTSVRIHLEHDSPMISKHHTNWRMQAIRSLERETPNELHYSSVVAAGEEDLPKIREVLVKAIEQVREIVKASDNQRIYCYSLDLFDLSAT